MVLSHERFSGLFIPHVTPFDNLGALDSESLTRLTKHFCSLPGVAGLVSCARIGESPVLNLDEKRRVYEISGKAAREGGKVHIATIAPQSTDEAVGLMHELENLPVDGVMIFPPLLFAWGNVDPNLKVRFFEDLAAETKLPVVLFQIPVKSYYYDPDTICRIARLENVVAFKEASFDIDLFSETVQRLRRDRAAMRILTGNDRFVAESYKLGAHGALIGVANVATEKWGALDIAGRAGKFDEAAAIQSELASVKELVFSEPIVEAVARIKIVLQREGLIKTAKVRRPQLGVSEAEKKQLLESYQALKNNEFRAVQENTQVRKRQAAG
ncbi:MAG TPA: dihydrodipicolinate synthase family protein [Candidatus Saccharimonadales bacterium]|nr:dihydrodipicolinate synthase family protein [Candidatus Saccharimonadales bacterium]